MANRIKKDGSYDKRTTAGRTAKGLTNSPKKTTKKMEGSMKNTGKPGKKT